MFEDVLLLERWSSQQLLDRHMEAETDARLFGTMTSTRPWRVPRSLIVPLLDRNAC